MTVDELVQKWDLEKWPEGLQRCEHNNQWLMVMLKQHLAKNKFLSFDDLDGFVRTLGDSRTGGKLLYLEVGANPAVLPHADDASLAWLDSIDAINEATPDKIRRFMQPAAIDSGLHARFNERVEHLRKYKIRRAKVESKAEVPLTPQQQARKKGSEALAAIHALVDALHGYTDSVTKFKISLHGRINQMVSDGDSLEATRKYTEGRIRDYELGSPR